MVVHLQTDSSDRGHHGHSHARTEIQIPRPESDLDTRQVGIRQSQTEKDRASVAGMSTAVMSWSCGEDEEGTTNEGGGEGGGREKGKGSSAVIRD
jgi:hypothetical protein